MHVMLAIGALLASARIAGAEEPEGWWAAPVARGAVTAEVVEEDARPYSTEVRPRDVTGAVSLACERVEGRPCGDGLRGFAELDAAAGYRDRVIAGARARLGVASEEGEDVVVLDRLFLRARWGGVGAAVGRDVLALGPVARTRLAWGMHAPAFDHARVETLAPIALHPSIRIAGLYAVGRLRAPQTFDGNLASIARGELELGARVTLGATHLLQLGGEGATSRGVVDFVLEHVRRKDASASATDSSNRRAGIDVTLRVPELHGGRVYYAVMFEDARRAHFVDAYRYDADHVLGLAVGRVSAEWTTTGVRSQEHVPRRTGFTNAGRVVGAPLGPDARSLFVGVRADAGEVQLAPWIELATLASDTYTFVVDGPIAPATRGPREDRYRLGLEVRAPIHAEWAIEGSAWGELVEDAAFVSGMTDRNAGLRLTIVWMPRWRVGGEGT